MWNRSRFLATNNLNGVDGSAAMYHASVEELSGTSSGVAKNLLASTLRATDRSATRWWSLMYTLSGPRPEQSRRSELWGSVTLAARTAATRHDNAPYEGTVPCAPVCSAVSRSATRSARQAHLLMRAVTVNLASPGSGCAVHFPASVVAAVASTPGYSGRVTTSSALAAAAAGTGLCSRCWNGEVRDSSQRSM